MNQEPRDDEGKESTHDNKPRRAFILTENTVVYEAESDKSENNGQNQPTVVSVQSHLPVELKTPARDRVFGWIDIIVAVLTFVVLVYYTQAAFIQANAAMESANAAAVAATVAKDALNNTKESVHI